MLSVLKEFWLEYSLGSGIILTLPGLLKGPDSLALMRCDCRHPERLWRGNFHLSFKLSRMELPCALKLCWSPFANSKTQQLPFRTQWLVVPPHSHLLFMYMQSGTQEVF